MLTVRGLRHPVAHVRLLDEFCRRADATGVGVKGCSAGDTRGYGRDMPDDIEHHSPDATLVRNQPQLTSASGTTWIIVAVISTALLAPMLLIIDGLAPVGFAAVIIMLVLVVSMMVVRVLVRAGRERLIALAGLYATLLAVALIATLVIAARGA